MSKFLSFKDFFNLKPKKLEGVNSLKSSWVKQFTKEELNKILLENTKPKIAIFNNLNEENSTLSTLWDTSWDTIVSVQKNEYNKILKEKLNPHHYGYRWEFFLPNWDWTFRTVSIWEIRLMN